tara:strand:- start:411 stop:1121 length:711 start_codon:yes stop_codon:yes gene_type:complete
MKSLLKEIRSTVNNTKPLPKKDYSVDYIKENSIVGIDISHHQGEINWEKVKKWRNHDIKFIYIKATEGSFGDGSKDKKYKYNITEAKKNGILVGSYHYFRTTSSAEDQFNNFINTIKDHEQDIIPMIDLEQNDNYSKKKYREELNKFIKLVEEHFNQKPILYSLTNFYNKYLANYFLDYNLFLGFYNLEYEKINLKDDKKWSIWQFSQQGKVEGIKSNVDISVINNDITLNEIILK